MKFIKLERDSGTHSEIQRTSKGKRYLKTKLTLKRQKLPQRGGTLEFFKEFSKMQNKPKAQLEGENTEKKQPCTAKP